jgi:hypothetical protein
MIDRRTDISMNVGDEREILPPLREHGPVANNSAQPKPSAKALSVIYNGKTTAIDLTAQPHEKLKQTDSRDKSEHTYSCISLTPLFAAAGVPQSDKLHGKAVSLVAVAEAQDNYHAAFSLAELDESVGATKAYVCDADNGKPLNEKEAPLKLLVTTDKHPSRSVRMLASITVKSAE